MANRTTIVDNNTWNNTHIATVGRVMASDEKTANKIARSLDAKYVLVMFGGYTHHYTDDISKFLWMVRIAGSVYPEIKEADYKNPYYSIDNNISKAMKKSLMYRLSYYRFGETRLKKGSDRGYDRMRNAFIGYKDYDLKYFNEVFTSKNWLMRIFEVLPVRNRAKKMKVDKKEEPHMETTLEVMAQP